MKRKNLRKEIESILDRTQELERKVFALQYPQKHFILDSVKLENREGEFIITKVLLDYAKFWHYYRWIYTVVHKKTKKTTVDICQNEIIPIESHIKQ